VNTVRRARDEPAARLLFEVKNSGETRAQVRCARDSARRVAWPGK